MTNLTWIDGQAFADYRDWECYRCGFWTQDCGTRHDGNSVTKAADLLKSVERFRDACKTVIRQWPVSVAVHLSNQTSNGRSYLGQASCWIVCDARKCCTVEAWWKLTKGEQAVANEIAGREAWLWYSENVNFQKQRRQLVFPFTTQPESESSAPSIPAKRSM